MKQQDCKLAFRPAFIQSTTDGKNQTCCLLFSPHFNHLFHLDVHHKNNCRYICFIATSQVAQSKNWNLKKCFTRLHLNSILHLTIMVSFFSFIKVIDYVTERWHFHFSMWRQHFGHGVITWTERSSIVTHLSTMLVHAIACAIIHLTLYECVCSWWSDVSLIEVCIVNS